MYKTGRPKKPLQTKEEIATKFWSKIDIKGPNDCWCCLSISGCGYGQFWDGKNNLRAHRVAWTITNGPIPKGLLVLHKCDNKPCCNPNHLYIGNQGDNIADEMDRYPGFTGITQTKLHEGEIWLIRRLRISLERPTVNRKYKFPASFVAKMFKVEKTAIQRIWNSSSHLCKEGIYV